MLFLKKTSIVILICLSGISAFSTRTIGQTVEWDFFEEVVLGFSSDILDLAKQQTLNKETITSIKPKISDLADMLDDYENAAEIPKLKIQRVRELIGAIRVLINNIENDMSTVEESIAFIEQAIAEYESKTAPLPNSEEIEVSVYYVRRSPGEREFTQLTDSDKLRSGDQYKIIFVPEKDCYVYIFQADSSGKIYQLFPMESFGGVVVNNFNPVDAGTVYYVPAEDKSFRLDDLIGVETFYFVVSRNRDYSLERKYAQTLSANSLEEQLAEIDNLLSYALSSFEANDSVNSQGSQAKSTSIVWQENGENFTLFSQLLTGICSECIKVSTFQHQGASER